MDELGMHDGSTCGPWWIVACLVLLLIGGPLCTWASELFGKKDPGSVVYDEIAAMPLVFLFVPVTPWTLALSFLWFRLFDILKPWPIRKLEHLPRGWGVMIDDTMAALYAAVCLWGTVLLLVQFGQSV